MKNQSIMKEIKSLNDKAFALAGKPENNVFPKFSSSQLLIIDYMIEHEKEDIYQKDFEDILKLTRATVSSVLGTLEKYEIVERTVDEVDTRAKKIVLTKKAKDYYNFGREKMARIEELVTDGITREELDKLFSVIKKMNENLDKERIKNVRD